MAARLNNTEKSEENNGRWTPRGGIPDARDVVKAW
jgi:hypothetical protein